MIDEAVLEDLFALTADSLNVPGDGPARILDERDRQVRGAGARAASPARARSTRRRLAIATAAAAAVVVVVMAATLLTGGGGGTKSPSSNFSQPPVAGGAVTNTSGTAVAATPVYAGASGGTSGSAIADGAGAAVAAPLGGPVPATSPNQVPGAQTKVIKTASVSIQVPQKGLTGAMSRLNTIAGGQGGFVQTSGTNGTSTGQPANGSATLRIPAANFATAVNQVEDLGTPTSVTTSGQDVTSQYVDLQARLQSLQETRTQFEQILAKAQSIPDILSVEQQISDIQTQIEQLQGQINVMDDQTSYSTITVTMSEASASPATAAPPHFSGISKAWTHAHRSFTNGIESVLAASGGIAVFLVFAVIAALIGRLAWGQARRRLL